MWKLICAVLLLPFVVQAEFQGAARCRYYDHPIFGYGCEVADLEFLAGDELQITGNHLTGRSNANVVFVEILNSTVEVIPQQFFISFPILNRFYAQGVSLSTLNRILNCANLRFLFLSGNYLEVINSDVFADCGNLEVLHLQNNNINNIERWAFRNLDKLEVLLLTNNQLQQINADLFTPVPNLLDLGLSNNMLTTLNSRTFTPIAFLETLRLANNYLSVLNVNILANLTQLNTLLLNGNQFDNFQANFFRHLPNLRQLNLNDNLVSCEWFKVRYEDTEVCPSLDNVDSQPSIWPQHPTHQLVNGQQFDRRTLDQSFLEQREPRVLRLGRQQAHNVARKFIASKHTIGFIGLATKRHHSDPKQLL